MNYFYLLCIAILFISNVTAKKHVKNYYNEKEILAETNWKRLAVQENAPNHLNLISQGKYNENLIGKYDKNYYYPASAGQDIDIFVFDGGFTFDNEDFKNKNERTAKCLFYIENGNITMATNPDRCYGHADSFHGMLTSITAAGKIYGVAKKSNVYGVVIHYDDYDDEDYLPFYSDILIGLKYVREHYFRPHKAIFSFSFGDTYSRSEYEERREVLDELQALITEMANEGAIFVAAAGNESTDTADFIKNDQMNIPSDFENVISVGGIQNNVKSDIIVMPNDGTYDDEMKTERYIVDQRSNYGARVDIYAPFWMHYTGSVYFEEIVYKYVVYVLGVDILPSHVTPYENGYLTDEIEFIISGTSFSTPIVAGIAATVMSENPDIQFNSKSMLEYLTAIGEKDIIRGIPKGAPNVFVNNGKRTVYSSDGKYFGCGPLSGNKKCAGMRCCSRESKCSKMAKSCSLNAGCQIGYGYCSPRWQK